MSWPCKKFQNATFSLHLEKHSSVTFLLLLSLKNNYMKIKNYSCVTQTTYISLFVQRLVQRKSNLWPKWTDATCSHIPADNKIDGARSQ